MKNDYTKYVTKVGQKHNWRHTRNTFLGFERVEESKVGDSLITRDHEHS